MITVLDITAVNGRENCNSSEFIAFTAVDAISRVVDTNNFGLVENICTYCSKMSILQP
jgi:hypothetical protein